MEVTDKSNNHCLLSKQDVKLKEVRMAELDTSLTQLPKSFDDWLSSMKAFSTAGKNIASLLESILDQTPLQQITSKYKRACDDMHDTCTNQETILTQDFTTSCQQIGPMVSALRSSLLVRDKMESKFVLAQDRLTSVSSCDSKSKAKHDQAELRCENTLRELNEQEKLVTKSSEHLESTIEKALGSWLLNVIGVQSQLMTDTLSVMTSLSSYKGLDVPLFLSCDPLVKEATLQWLANSQVHPSIRSSDLSLSPSSLHWLSSTTNDSKLPEYSRNKLNTEVDTLLKGYISILNQAINVIRSVPGGFHLNPKGIELALKDCCSTLDAKSAGVPHFTSREEREELIERDIPFSSYRIDTTLLNKTKDIQTSIQEKLMFIEKLVSSLSESESISSDKLQEFAFLVLSESCSSLIESTSKTAVQLLYGKSNLALVKRGPSENIIEISGKDETTIVITATTVWHIVEDYITLSPLSRPPHSPSHDSFLATVETIYSMELNLTQFIDYKGSYPLIPNIQVKCSSTNDNYFSSRTKRSPHRNKEHHSHSDLTLDHTHHHSGRLSSSGSDIQDDSASTDSAHTITSPLLDPPPLEKGRSQTRPLPRSNSSDSISTTTTLKASHQYEETDDILSVLSSNSGLTHNILQEHTTKETKPSNPRRYSSRRKEPTLPWAGEGGCGFEGRGSDEMLEIVGINKRKDKSNSTSSLLDTKYTPATAAEFDNVFKYLGDGGGGGRHTKKGYSSSSSSYHRQQDYNTSSIQAQGDNSEPSQEERNFTTANADVISGGSKSLEDYSSQVILGREDEEEEREERHGNPHNIVSSSTCSLDSGIGGHYRNGNSLKRNGRLSNEENNWEPSFYNHRRLGPFLQNVPLPSDSSDSETTSGRNSRDNTFQSSQEDIPGRSSSRSSYHSLSGGRPGSRGGDSDTFSLPDTNDLTYIPFNQAPGSHRGVTHHRRNPSLTSYDRLSQEGYDQLASRGSFSQELPMTARSQDAPPIDFMHHHNSGPTQGHFSHPYEHDPSLVMRPNSQYLSDPYPGGPPSFHPPPPPHQRPFGPPPPGPRPPHYWDGGFGGGPHMMPHPPHRGPHPPPPPHDMFRPPFRTTTPDMSPAPSPHPTPPTTPPPPIMQPSPPIRLGHAPRPHLPNMFHGPPPLRGDYHHMAPPPPHMTHHQPPPPRGHVPHPSMGPHPPRGPLAPPPHNRMMDWSGEQQPPPHWRH